MASNENEGEDMQYGEIPITRRQIGSRNIWVYGDMSVMEVSKDKYIVAFGDGREIDVPRDMARSKEGKWGTVLLMTGARYMDDKTSVSDELKRKIISSFRAAYAANNNYLEISE